MTKTEKEIKRRRTRQLKNTCRPGRIKRAIAAVQNGFRYTFLSRDGKPRTGWVLTAFYIGYYLWVNGIKYALSWWFGILFERWNLRYDNLSAAPAWAAFLATYYGVIISLVTNIGAVVIALKIIRNKSSEVISSTKPSLRPICMGMLVSIAGAAVPALIFILTDSMRLMSNTVPASIIGIIAMIPVYFVAALSESILMLPLVYDFTKRRLGYVAGCLAAIVVFLLAGGGLTLNPVGIINLVLTGIFMVSMYQRSGLWFTVVFRFGWSFITTIVFSFPSSSTIVSPIFELYWVSENVITGGSSGLMCGLWTTAFMVILLVIVFWPSLCKIPAYIKSLHKKGGKTNV